LQYPLPDRRKLPEICRTAEQAPYEKRPPHMALGAACTAGSSFLLASLASPDLAHFMPDPYPQRARMWPAYRPETVTLWGRQGDAIGTVLVACRITTRHPAITASAPFEARGGMPAPAHRPIHRKCGKLILQDTIGGRPKRAILGRCRGGRKPNFSEYQ
jgi:hypothetical protein